MKFRSWLKMKDRSEGPMVVVSGNTDAARNALRDLVHGEAALSQEETPRVIVRAPNWLGDTVLATAVVQRLAERLPGARFDIWCKPSLAPLYGGPLFVGGRTRHPRARVRFLPQGKGPVALKWAARGIRTCRAHAALLLAPSMRAGLETALAGVPMRVGYPDDHRGWLLTHRIIRQRRRARGRFAPPFGRHILEEWFEAADQLAVMLGAPPTNATRPVPMIHLSDEARQDVRELLPQLHPRADRPLILVHAFSNGGSVRSWPAGHYAELVARIREVYEADIVLVGGPDTGEGVKALAGQCPPGVAVRAGASALPLLTLAALAPYCDVFVSNDTGPMHLAAAAGARVVAIFGSTRPELTGPVGSGHVHVRRTDLSCAGCYRRRCPFQLECLAGLPVAHVFEAVVAVLEGRPVRHRATRGAFV